MNESTPPAPRTDDAADVQGDPRIYIGSYDQVPEVVDVEIVSEAPSTGSDIVVYDPAVAAKAGYVDGMLEAEVIEDRLTPPVTERSGAGPYEAAMVMAALRTAVEVMNQSPAERYMNGLQSTDEVDKAITSLLEKNQAAMGTVKAEDATEQPASPVDQVFTQPESHIAATVLNHAQATLERRREEHAWLLSIRPEELFADQHEIVEAAVLEDVSLKGSPDERRALLQSVYDKMSDALKATVDENLAQARHLTFTLAA